MLVGAWINAILNPLQRLAAKGFFMQQFSATVAGGTLDLPKLHFVNRNCLQTSALQHLGLSSTLCGHTVSRAGVAVCKPRQASPVGRA